MSTAPRRRLAYLGPPGTFTHQAVLALRPEADAVPVAAAADALALVEAGEAAAAVLPVDNSVNGVVVPTLDALLARPDVAVADSVVVPISFEAFVLDPEAERTVVVSHPHALAQCHGFIAELGLPTREASSTAAACRDLAPGEVGIGPAVCGPLYGLSVLRSAVEDHAAAFTQFALVAPTAPGAAAPATGGEGLLVALDPDRNEPGLLRRLLEVLERRGINMTNLVTRPVPTSPGEFVFLLFLAGSAESLDDAGFAAMREDWAGLGARARALGRISPLAALAARHVR